MKKNHKQAVAAIIESHGLFLLGKRSSHKKIAPLYWCPITGKMEGGETEEEAIRREVFEEVGLIVEPLEKVATTETRNKETLIHWWKVTLISGDPTLKNDEHTELRWVPHQELDELSPSFEEDIQILKSCL